MSTTNKKTKSAAGIWKIEIGLFFPFPLMHKSFKAELSDGQECIIERRLCP